MNTLDLIIVFLSLLVIYLYTVDSDLYQTKSTLAEKFGETSKSNLTYEERMKQSIINKIHVLEDADFADVVFHRSVPVWGEMTGLQKCMDNCNGTCVEFGYTNDAMCYPK